MTWLWLSRALAIRRDLLFVVAGVGAITIALSGGLQLLGISLNYRFLSAQPDLLIFVGLTGFGGLVGARYGGEKACSLGLFLGCAAALVATANLYFLAVADYSILMDHDSPAYLHINDCRVVGYWVFLSLFETIDARWLIAVQLNLVLASQVAMSCAVRRVTNSAVAGMATLLIATLFAQLYSLSFFVLTEPLFAAAFGFAAAASIAYVRSPSNRLAVASGLSIAIAIPIKTVAPPLLIANAFILLRPAKQRGFKALGAIGIPILCLSVLMIFSRVSYGSWSPPMGGYALAENTVWGVRSDRLSSDPAISGAIESALEPFVREQPSPKNANAYLAWSWQNLDTMFWGKMLPIVYNRYRPRGSILECPSEVNNALSRLAIEAILRNPRRYAAQAGVQYYGLWGFALTPQMWRDHALAKRTGLAGNISSGDWETAPAAWRLLPGRLSTIETGAAVYEKHALFLDQLKNFGVRLLTLGSASVSERTLRYLSYDSRDATFLLNYRTVAFGLLTLAIACLAPWIGRLRPDVAALALLALLINTYFVSHAIFMFALPRYAACAEIPLAAFFSILGFTAISKIACPVARRLVAISRGQILVE